MADQSKTSDMINWVGFPDSKARLRRVILPNGMRALHFRADDSPEGDVYHQNALAFGFSPLKNRNTSRMILKDGKAPFGIRELASGLGGEPIKLPRDEFMSSSWTIVVKNQTPKSTASIDPRDLLEIGLNSRGDTVYRDGDGVAYRRVTAQGDSRELVSETSGGATALFLRATREGDFDAIAAGLMRMAARGGLSKADFDRVVDASLAPGVSDPVAMSRDAAAERVRQGMIREVLNTNGGVTQSRQNFQRAIRMADKVSDALSRVSNAAGYSPSIPVSVFLRRVMHDFADTSTNSAINVHGSPDLEVGLPRGRDETAALQIHDLSTISSNHAEGFLFNALSRRPDQGHSAVIIPGDYHEDKVEDLRRVLGLNYAIESVSRIAPQVAEGIQDSNPVTMIFVGERRPETLDALPAPVLRNLDVQVIDDLVSLEAEVQRSRGRIRGYHQGQIDPELDTDDAREDTQRHRPYRALSQRGKAPITMVPVALEGATYKALERLRRDADYEGGVDAMVANRLGYSLETLEGSLSSEQVDALGLIFTAKQRERSFLLADQTGIGKGQVGAAASWAHLREDPANRVLYFTEKAAINIPDVVRDLRAIGAWGKFRALFLSVNSVVEDVTIDSETGESIVNRMESPPRSERLRILESGEWPDDIDMILTTYSQFNTQPDSLNTDWLTSALDERCFVVLDEAHNALNPKSNIGRNIRSALRLIPRENVLHMTATPMKTPDGMDLYEGVFPDSDNVQLEEIFESVKKGGEVAQETFTTMMAEEGTFLRRDHNISNIEFRIDLPSDERMTQYQEVMDRVSPIFSSLLDASLIIRDAIDRDYRMEYANRLRNGMGHDIAAEQAGAMNQYSFNLSGPLSTISRTVMNTLKVDQVIDQVRAEIDAGRKPMITFNSTNEAILKEAASGDDNRITEASMLGAGQLTMRDQIRRISERVFFARRHGERVDFREQHPHIQTQYEHISQLIDALPDNLSVSPIDDLIEKLQANDISTGEISGRSYTYRNDRIAKRSKRDKDRRAVIDGYNEGDIDVLIYNSAGSTGGSYHAGEGFGDQRPRTVIEMEAPLDVTKYVQSMGRANRYDQVAPPRFITVSTGLVPEMRIEQQRNRKLRSLGASVDGNRSHPMLLEDMPDLLNRVGDEASANVLLAHPDIVRRLGLDSVMNSLPTNDGQMEIFDTGSGVPASGIQSLSNKVLTRAVILPGGEQSTLLNRIHAEFDAIIEEYENRGTNPLRPREVDGYVDFTGGAVSLFHGRERDDDDLDASAFTSPIYIHTGRHVHTRESWSSEQLIAAVEECRRLYGGDGFSPYAERMHQRLPMEMMHALPEGMSIEAALRNPENAGQRFRARHMSYTNLAWLLENMVPGVEIRFPTPDDPNGRKRNVIVGFSEPREIALANQASAFKIDTIAPGESVRRRTTLSRILSSDDMQENVRFMPGISDAIDPAFLRNFDDERAVEHNKPAQVLSGNMLDIISMGRRYELGSIALYRDENNQVRRGLIVTDSKKDLNMLPVRMSNPMITAGFVRQELDAALVTHERNFPIFKLWGTASSDKLPPSDISKADLRVTVTKQTVSYDLPPPSRSNHDFYACQPGLYESLYDEALPDPEGMPARLYRRSEEHKHMVRFPATTPEECDRAIQPLLYLTDTNMLASGSKRESYNLARERHDRIQDYLGAHETITLDRVRGAMRDANEIPGQQTAADPGGVSPAQADRATAAEVAEADEAPAMEPAGANDEDGAHAAGEQGEVRGARAEPGRVAGRQAHQAFEIDEIDFNNWN